MESGGEGRGRGGREGEGRKGTSVCLFLSLSLATRYTGEAKFALFESHFVGQEEREKESERTLAASQISKVF